MKLPTPSYLLIGFLIIAAVSGWLNLKNAAVVDAFGDVVSLQADISESELKISKLREVVTDEESSSDEKKEAEEKIDKIEEEIKEDRKEIREQRVDAQQAAASVPNGVWIWTLIVQIGVIILGIGLVVTLTDKEEDSRLRSVALFILGMVSVYLLITRTVGLAAAGIMGGVLN